ncbi:MAG: YchE family NAAT transporter [Arsenophonus sp.]|nr:MAG: YchE family NAAT transporter [Arsenophonus sp.]
MSENLLNFSNYINFFLILFIIINPIGVMPVFITMSNHQSIKDRNHTNLITNVTVSIILCISLIFGESFLNLFSISINAFRISGGLCIIIIAIPMILDDIKKKKNYIKRNENKEKYKNLNHENIAIVPLALPLMAGPGAITSCIIWSSNWYNFKNIIGLCLTSIFFSFCCWLFFRSSVFFSKYLGKTGIKVMTRIMGLLLITLGIEFIMVGVKEGLLVSV